MTIEELRALSAQVERELAEVDEVMVLQAHEVRQEGYVSSYDRVMIWPKLLDQHQSLLVVSGAVNRQLARMELRIDQPETDWCGELMRANVQLEAALSASGQLCHAAMLTNLQMILAKYQTIEQAMLRDQKIFT